MKLSYELHTSSPPMAEFGMFQYSVSNNSMHAHIRNLMHAKFCRQRTKPAPEPCNTRLPPITYCCRCREFCCTFRWRHRSAIRGRDTRCSDRVRVLPPLGSPLGEGSRRLLCARSLPRPGTRPGQALKHPSVFISSQSFLVLYHRLRLCVRYVSYFSVYFKRLWMDCKCRPTYYYFLLLVCVRAIL